MLIDENVRKELLERLKNLRDEYEATFDLVERDYHRADCVEQLMAAKKTLLMNLVMDMPLGGDDCYFCIQRDAECEGCPYGAVHGKCSPVQQGQTSDWMDVYNARNELRDALCRYYFGESYRERGCKGE